MAISLQHFSKQILDWIMTNQATPTPFDADRRSLRQIIEAAVHRIPLWCSPTLQQKEITPRTYHLINFDVIEDTKTDIIKLIATTPIIFGPATAPCTVDGLLISNTQHGDCFIQQEMNHARDLRVNDTLHVSPLEIACPAIWFVGWKLTKPNMPQRAETGLLTSWK